MGKVAKQIAHGQKHPGLAAAKQVAQAIHASTEDSALGIFDTAYNPIIGTATTAVFLAMLPKVSILRLESEELTKFPKETAKDDILPPFVKKTKHYACEENLRQYE